MSQKERYQELEKVATKIIEIAEEEKITVEDFNLVMDIAREMAKNSIINTEKIKNFEFPSQYL